MDFAPVASIDTLAIYYNPPALFALKFRAMTLFPM
jgi:hypothetical protein